MQRASRSREHGFPTVLQCPPYGALPTLNTDVVTEQPPCDLESAILQLRCLQSRKQESKLESTMRQATKAPGLSTAVTEFAMQARVVKVERQLITDERS